jgi:uncharacterized protein (DUF58 family)
MIRRLAAFTEPLLFKLFRHTIPKGHELTLERRRIYALPTRHGLLYAAMLLVMLLGSINYNNSLGFMLTFLLASMGVMSILYTYRNIAHLRLRSGKAAPTFAGKEARFTIHLHNAEPFPRCALRLTAAGGEESALTDIAARDSTGVELVVMALKRGRLRLGKITLSTTYPLGLVRAWAYVDLDMHCIVYPQPGPYRPLAATPHHHQLAHAGLTAGSDDFLGFRPYQAGDSLRHIHWKSLARALPLLTKKFTAGEAPDLWLDWTALPSPDNEARLRILCRLVLEAQRSDQAYGLRLPGVEIPPAQGVLHQHRCLEALALFGEARP